MKKTIITISILFLIIIFINPTNIISSVQLSFNICIKNLFPTLFPFLLLSNIMTNYGFIEICAKIGNIIIKKIFKINQNGFYVLIMSMLSGSPSNAKYINQLLEKKLINHYEANQLLTFTHCVNPLFIIGTIGITFLKSKTIGIIILISHYLGNIITGIIMRKKNIISDYKISSYNPNKSFIKVLTHSINDTINTLMLILGVVTTCLIFTTVVSSIIHINPIYSGILEITQGINYIYQSNLNIMIKTIFITFIISFGGLSIHMQVMSILENKKIRYLPYFIARLIHAILSSIIVFILYKTIL